jgi:hypothetical protein
MTETESIQNIEQALAELGVSANTLTPLEKKTLDEQGFIIFPNLIDKKWLEQLRNNFEKIAQERCWMILRRKAAQPGLLPVHTAITA